VGFRRSTRPSRWRCCDAAPTWACQTPPPRTCATAGLRMSSTGTDALCSSHTTWQGLGSPRSARQVSRPSTTRQRVSSDGLPSSMNPTHGSALTKNSTILTLGQHPILLPSAARLLLQEFNCVESAQDPSANPAAGDDVDERDSDGPRPAAPLPLPPLHKLASQHRLRR
jgi:hypothetical protein